MLKQSARRLYMERAADGRSGHVRKHRQVTTNLLNLLLTTRERKVCVGTECSWRHRWAAKERRQKQTSWLSTGHLVDEFRSQWSMQSLWKRWPHGSLRTASPSSNSPC